MNAQPASVTAVELRNEVHNSLPVTPSPVADTELVEFFDKSKAVTLEPVTDKELSAIGDNSKAVTWKPSDDYTRISGAMKYGERCGKCEKPIGRFFPIVRGEAPFRYSGPFGSGTKYLKTVLCLECAPTCYRKWNLGSCEVCFRPYYRRSQRAKHWFCCDRCEWRYRNQLAKRRRGQPDSRTCQQCGQSFKARADSRHCSPACRQKAYRQRTGKEKPAPHDVT